jgi:hypothetical protein
VQVSYVRKRKNGKGVPHLVIVSLYLDKRRKDLLILVGISIPERDLQELLFLWRILKLLQCGSRVCPP